MSSFGLVGSVKGQDLELTLPEAARKRFSRFAIELRNLGTTRVERDADDLCLAIRFEVVSPVRANGRRGEKYLGSQFTGRVLQPEPEWVAVFPVNEQHVAPPVTVDVDHLNSLCVAREGDLLRLGQHVI